MGFWGFGVQDTSKPDIDGAELAARKGKIMSAKAEVLRLKQQEKPSLPGPDFEVDVANKKHDLHEHSLAAQLKALEAKQEAEQNN